MSELLADRLSRSPLFEPAEYLRLNPDLRGLDPLEHFLHWGAWEPHRHFVERREFARTLGAGSKGLSAGRVTPTPAHAPANAMGLDVGVYVSSQGRFFVTEIARMLASELSTLGARARLLDETAEPAERPAVSVFVAPHEFFGLGQGARWPRSEVLATSYVFCTDQITSPHFRATFPYALSAKGALDLYPHGAAVWREAGVPAAAYAPRYSPAGPAPREHGLFRGLSRAAREAPRGGEAWAERPLDLAFFGSESAARDEFFARHAGFLADRRCVVHYTRSLGVPLSDDYNGRRMDLTRHIAARSRIWLHLHRGDVGTVHWPSMVMFGAWSGALVVSSPCAPHPDHQAGLHYLEESPRRMSQLLRWLLNDPDGEAAAERIRAEAADALRRPRETDSGHLVEFLSHG